MITRRDLFKGGAAAPTGIMFYSCGRARDQHRSATSMIRSITARATCCFLKPRTLRRDCTSVSKSMFEILKSVQGAT